MRLDNAYLFKHLKLNKMEITKQFLRKRNKLVTISANLKGEELEAIELAIKIMDMLIDEELILND